MKYLKREERVISMQKKAAKIRKGLWEVFQKPAYLGIALLAAILFFLINILLPNLKALKTVIAEATSGQVITFIGALIQGGVNSITTTSLYVLVIISLLIGIVLSLLLYKVKMVKMFSMQDGKATTIGAILGLAAPGCASCGIGVLSAVGLTSTLAYLPFKGVEIGLVSIALLMTSTGSLASRIADGNTCSLKAIKKK